MKTFLLGFAAAMAAIASSSMANAEGSMIVERLNENMLALVRSAPEPAAIYLSDDTELDASDRLAFDSNGSARVELKAPADKRLYVIVVPQDGKPMVTGERVLPLEQGSNFRDIGGYRTRDGHTVRWDRVFRSGAMPLLAEDDYALLRQLEIGAIVDFRSLEERQIAPDALDDRTGALFLSNDYSIKALLATFGGDNGENVYRGMEDLLAPQLRMLFNRLMEEKGAVLYHCSAGQDRTGIATALIYDMLGVPRETILADYHLSTSLRRPQYEMPQLDPADYPGNPIVQYYAAKQDMPTAEPLYAPSGASHLAQFFDYLDERYGGTEGYLKQKLGLTDEDMQKLRDRLLS